VKNTDSARIHGFPPLARPGARILILGSMPSRESLARGQYYAHPRNAFWPILSDLLGIEAPDYERRAEAVADHGIAIWDVLRDCIRPGSLDSAIEEQTAATNDFRSFFEEQQAIRHVFFNGAKAESLYLRCVRPGLGPKAAGISCTRLPSTSPANAGMDFQAKKKAWGKILGPGLE
jgi:TDG/mug DNA glycosylase family protein